MMNVDPVPKQGATSVMRSLWWKDRIMKRGERVRGDEYEPNSPRVMGGPVPGEG